MAPGAMSQASQFNPELFAYEPGVDYPWLVYPEVTVAIVTWDRLDCTKQLLASLERHTHLPYSLLVVDNASTDGTREFLMAYADQYEHVRLVLNARNLGQARAHYQIQQEVSEGLLVICDDDVELLSNYWLVHTQKAFHALRVAGESLDVALGFRLLNCEEYGFIHGRLEESYFLPTARNASPRSSYAAVNKDEGQAAELLDEQVLISWTNHLVGPINALPAELYGRLNLKDQYPTLIGGTDSYQSAEILALGGRLGYLKNGPVARHNDWPYSEEKAQVYGTVAYRRARFDLHYLRWKLRQLLGRGKR